MMSTKTPIIFIHGTRTSKKIWEKQEAFLHSRGHHVISIDLPGHGVHREEPFTLPRAYDIIQNAVANCASPPILVGLSLGGYVSLGYAAHDSHQIAGVIGSGCLTGTRNPLVRLYGRLLSLLRLPDKVTEHGLTSWGTVSEMLREVGNMSLKANLSRVKVPMHFISGKWDILRIGTFRYKTIMKDKNITNTIINKIGHDVNQATQAYNSALSSTLSRMKAISPPA